MDRIPAYLPGNRNMVALMSRQCVGIVDRQHLLVLVGDNHHLRAALTDWDDEQMAAAAEALRRVAGAVTQAAESVRRVNTSTGD